MQKFVTDPAQHYDRVTLSWRYLLGNNLHYGCFRDETEDLETATEELTRRMARSAELRAGSSVLDVGCGIGQPATHLVREFGCGVVGISTSPVGIETARRLAQERGLADRLAFEVRDGMRNGFPDQSFDCVWVLESSHLMDDRRALVSECSRVLRPGGRLVLCDIMLRRNMPLSSVMRHARKFLLLDAVFGRARMETLATYAQLAKESDLLVEREDDLTDATYPTFASWKANATRHSDEVRALIGQAALEEFQRSCDVLESFWREGVLGYGLLSAARPDSEP